MFIVLYGSEPFLAEQKLKEIVESYKKTQKSGLNFYYFYADKGDEAYEEFKSAIETVSMFTEKKLIVFKNFFLEDSALAKKILDFAKKSGIEELKDVVVIFFEGGIPQKNKDFEILLKKPNLFQEFGKIEGAKLNNWIQKEFEKLGARIEPKAAVALVQAAGSDLYRLKNEIDKLANYKKNIVEKDVKELVVSDFHADIFSLIDAIARKDKKLSFEILNNHIQNGESEIYLLSMIVYQFRNLLKVKSLADKGLAAVGEIAKKAGIHPFVAKKTLIASRLFSFENLKSIYEKLFEIDIKIKTGEIEPQMALNLFIIEL